MEAAPIISSTPRSTIRPPPRYRAARPRSRAVFDRRVSLATLNGKSANGVWTLQVADTARLDTGTLDSWSLAIATAGEPSVVTDANGNYEFVDIAPGDHHIREILPSGFVETTPVGGAYNVTIGTGTKIGGQNFGNGPIQPAVMPPVMGDYNQDGHTDASDVPVLIAALADLNAYKTAYNLTDAGLLSFGDLDGDHAITNADLQALLTLLSVAGGSGSDSSSGENAPASTLICCDFRCYGRCDDSSAGIANGNCSGQSKPGTAANVECDCQLCCAPAPSAANHDATGSGRFDGDLDRRPQSSCSCRAARNFIER